MIITSTLRESAKKILEIAAENKMKIACAESCTGGLLSALFTEISGASKVFDRAFITYSNQAKTEMLGVKKTTIETCGAVSFETAKEMVEGVIKNSPAELAVAITGIAGPSGGSVEKPVGLVYIAVFNRRAEKLNIRKFNFAGDRDDVRKCAVTAALDMMVFLIEN